MPSDCGWYKTIAGNADLEQGDLLRKCPVIVPLDTIKQPQEATNYPKSKSEKSKAPRKAVQEVDAKVIEYNVIILTQSCDILKSSTKHLLVCKYRNLGEMQADSEYFRKNERLEDIRRGYNHKYHFLNKCMQSGVKDKFKTTDYLVLNFSQVFSIPKEYAIQHAENCGERLRLISPYKERMSQAFAKYYMRVALDNDEDISAFTEREEDD